MDKLTGESAWPRWKRQMELYLRSKKVMDVVDKTVTKPVETEGETAVQKAARETLEGKFLESDTTAQLIIVSNLDDHHSCITNSCKSSAEIWDKLISIYEQSNSQRLDRLLENFFLIEKKTW